ncbi:hypothetical protein GCK72_002225 [Caenorhabditis remanei]|uniref:Uncharacterized protein n=1 Tax=Caenorhabditis remanei TaxID=31234 RepID=A0A6A5HVU7_CAERE|nr:hypothetical protein GCK72_002225 [Caenorhabditis remanei]KAF1770407.1 hypothetical protein GCK72_002225 [Caenorhabditis remanei]
MRFRLKQSHDEDETYHGFPQLGWAGGQHPPPPPPPRQAFPEATRAATKAAAEKNFIIVLKPKMACRTDPFRQFYSISRRVGGIPIRPPAVAAFSFSLFSLIQLLLIHLFS